jgi:hypothetical protein
MINYEENGITLTPIEPHDRAWALFLIFALAVFEDDQDDDPEARHEFVERWDHHVDWVHARFRSPDAWLGSEGDDYREQYDGFKNPSPTFVKHWHQFNAAHATDSLADIDRMLGVLLHSLYTS